MVKRSVLYPIFLLSLLLFFAKSSAQNNLLLNGDFEDINTCVEYNAECGVEAWFYLKDVKAQMLENETNDAHLGKNSFAITFKWLGYESFAPLIGTILPCRLQQNKKYTFRGMIMVTINEKLLFMPGVALGEKFYVPKKSFSAPIRPDSIVNIKRIPASNFFSFEYSFTAKGNEKYLTFGTYIKEDTTSGKKKFLGAQAVTVILDNFQLLPADENEIACLDYKMNKEKLYNYNFRHKEMDYALFTKGDLPINFDTVIDTNYTTRLKIIEPVIKADTLRLGDVFFDFNKARLRPEAYTRLNNFFQSNNRGNSIDSIYVEGHTDSVGSNETNLVLSQHRCETVRDWLVENKIVTTGSIEIHPFGKSKPAASNKTAEGRALNRRVEIIVFRRETL